MAADNKNQKKIDSEIGQALFSDTERFEMWFSTYWKPAAAVALVIAIASALVFWIITSRNAADKKAAFALADANTAEALDAAIKANPDHSGTMIARFRLAKMLVDSEKYQEAIVQLDKIIKDTTAAPALAADAGLTGGYACELSGKVKEAISRFLAVEADLKFPAAKRAEAGYCAGRLLLRSGDAKQAKAVLARTGMMGSGNASIGYWTENAKQMLIAIDNGEYNKSAAVKKAAPAKKAAAVKKAAPAKKAAVKKAK